MKCNEDSKVTSVLLYNPKDIKEISKENGIILKRKYGKFKREVFLYENKKTK